MKYSSLKMLKWGPPALLAAPIFITWGLSAALGPRLPIFAKTALYLALLAVALTIIGLRHRALRRRLISAQGRVCIHCRYALTDLPSPGICPECGQAFPADGHASVWKSLDML